MKTMYVLIGFLLIRVTLFAQGIHFEEGLGWQQILSKAKHENKYIFVDCYATWCGPCKWMSKNVLSKKEVGDFVNDKFISVAVQMDRTATDEKPVKDWYADAKSIEQTYGIETYPSYLFFSPDGEIVHRVTGASSGEKEFLDKVKQALDPSTQVVTILQQYKQHLHDSAFLRNSIDRAFSMDDKKTAAQIGDAYIDVIKDPFTKDNLEILFKVTRSSADKGFRLLLTNEVKVGQVAGQLQNLEFTLGNILSNEEINPVFEARTQPLYQQKLMAGIKIKYPELTEGTRNYLLSSFRNNVTSYVQKKLQTPAPIDWKALKKQVQAQFPDTELDRILSKEKIRYYHVKKQWQQCGEAALDFFEKYGKELGGFELNNITWDCIFMYCGDKKVLAGGLKWMKYYIDNKNHDYQDIDTYANLLYKTGKRKEALEWERKAIDKLKKFLKMDPGALAEFESTIRKMENGEKTWNDGTPVAIIN